VAGIPRLALSKSTFSPYIPGMVSTLARVEANLSW
jgi:hypothetical protein